MHGGGVETECYCKVAEITVFTLHMCFAGDSAVAGH